MLEKRLIRAKFTDESITVYQAYPPSIADAALAADTFVSPFKFDRMTWIKPSFLWMMYRSGWGTKPGQERILAIEVARNGFDWALSHSSLSHYDRDTYPTIDDWRSAKEASPVRIQWDPDRSVRLEPLPRRAIQIGLSGDAVVRYTEEWILQISDITEEAHAIHEVVTSGALDAAESRVPDERVQG